MMDKNLVLDYIKENKISKKKFAAMIDRTPSQIYSYFNNYGSYDTIRSVDRFFEELKKQNNQQKYGVYLSDYEINKLNEFIHIINTSDEKKIEIIEWNNYNEKSDIFAYLKKYGVITHLDNYIKTGLFTDSDYRCTITFDATNVNITIPEIELINN
jgi:hypothetical protein